ncbi:MAG: 3'-phosphoadenosine 5'-phosphosulfate sulfotransferase (PAPS reductase)/FAD synthetase [Patiriisocius sp.]|jgi:3'-phosphoadenosine 5'-phosphosulfate sulfotransferase (PAPS reductase)/FAD synthetase
MVRHVLGISGGKDSAALALYMNERHPEVDVDYYTCDTGRELQETYDLIDRLESALGKKITRLHPVDLQNTTGESYFDHFLDMYGGYLPSSTARWCTKKLKLDPFEDYLGDEPTISYVGIRGDEDRDGYISKKQSVQSIFPFRKNIWSEDVVKLCLATERIAFIEQAKALNSNERFIELVDTAISISFSIKQKANALLDVDTKLFNRIVFELLKETDYPVGKLDAFPLIENDEILKIDDIFKILRESGVGVPAYYEPLDYEVEIDGEMKKGTYNRSRSGCFFCFFQQKIEWVWLLERHLSLYEKAMTYEKDGYTWMDSETLEELKQPLRVATIKKDHFIKTQKRASNTSWQDQILDAEGEGCDSCFI